MIQEVYTDLEKPNDLHQLYGWWFTYNHIAQLWSACKTEYIPRVNNEFFSDFVIKSKSFETLRDLIIKTDGDIDKMNTLANGI